MEMKTRCLVMGMKKFKGDVEGKNYDNTKIYIEESFAGDNENARGSASSEFPAGKSDVFDRFKTHVFPFQADLTLETSTTGRDTKTVVREIKPVIGQPGKPV